MSAARPADPPGGNIQIDGDRATLTFRRFFRHPPAAVWAAITDPEQVGRWSMAHVRSDQRAGGRVDDDRGPWGPHARGLILVWEPPHVYEYEWNIEPSDMYPSGEQTVVRWELTSQEGGTLVVMTHRNLTKRTGSVFVNGFSGFMDRLEAQLDGRPLPEWVPRRPSPPP